MKIQLTQGQHTVVDEEDYSSFVIRRWYLGPSGYASRFEKRRVIFLHREIMGCPENRVVDHINHNKLDNRRSNLRIVSKSANALNRVGANSNNLSTIIRGIHFSRKTGYYYCEIMKNGVRKRTTVNNLSKAKKIVREWQNA